MPLPPGERCKSLETSVAGRASHGVQNGSRGTGGGLPSFLVAPDASQLLPPQPLRPRASPQPPSQRPLRLCRPLPHLTSKAAPGLSGRPAAVRVRWPATLAFVSPCHAARMAAGGGAGGGLLSCSHKSAEQPAMHRTPPKQQRERLMEGVGDGSVGASGQEGQRRRPEAWAENLSAWKPREACGLGGACVAAAPAHTPAPAAAAPGRPPCGLMTASCHPCGRPAVCLCLSGSAPHLARPLWVSGVRRWVGDCLSLSIYLLNQSV